MNFNKKILPNGLRLVTIPMKDNPTVTVMVLVEAGSKYETREISGLSHFLEHMCFKGTTRRPKAIDIARELDAVGAQYNAFTSQEFTGYYAKADRRHFAKAIDVVSDLYRNPTFPDAEIEKEKGVIVEELNMYQDLPQRHVQNLFMALLYGDQPAGWNIIGMKETIHSMTRDHFLEYRLKHYVSGATTVLVAGNVSEASVESAVAEAFSGMHSGEKHGKTKVTEAQSAPAVALEHRKTDQTHIVLGVRTFDTYDARVPTLRVLTGVLGGGMSSRLFQRLREEMGVGYYVSAGAENLTDHGYLEISTGIDNRRLAEVVRAILAEMKRLRDEDVPADELRKVKDHLVGSLYLSLESSDAVADFYGYQEILRKELKTPEEAAKEIESVDGGALRTLAGQIFRDDRLNLALVGPVNDKAEVLKLLALP